MLEFPAEGARPIWIASYPRSGNTFLRIILEQAFGLASYSIYYVEGDQHADPSAEAIGSAPMLPKQWRVALGTATQGPPIPIKTHGPPTDDAPAIFVARDGRAVINSYYHYHKKFAFEQPSLTDIIAGACQFGSWSEHYWAWRPKTRPQTLLLYYDALVSRPQEIISELAKFLNLTPGQTALPEFEELQRRSPDFFRRGQNADYLAQWTPVQIALFNQLHAPAMEDLGFKLSPVEESAAEAARELAQSAARLHRLYLEELSKSAASAQSASQYLAQVQNLQKRIQELSGQIDRVYKPFLKKRWVRMGQRLGALPEVPDDVRQAARPEGSDQQLRSSGGNTRLSLPGPPPGSPSVPNEGTSAPC